MLGSKVFNFCIYSQFKVLFCLINRHKETNIFMSLLTSFIVENKWCYKYVLSYKVKEHEVPSAIVGSDANCCGDEFHVNSKPSTEN